MRRRRGLALLLAVGAVTLSGCGADEEPGDGTSARAAKERVDGVVRALIGAERARPGAHVRAGTLVRGEGSFTRCGLGAGSRQYVARVAVSSPAKGSSLARLRSVLEDRGFEVNDRDGELVAHDATDVTAVVYPRTPVSATPGLSMVRFSGSSPCVRPEPDDPPCRPRAERVDIT